MGYLLIITADKWIKGQNFFFLIPLFVKHIVALPPNSVKFYPCNDKLSETGFKLNQ